MSDGIDWEAARAALHADTCERVRRWRNGEENPFYETDGVLGLGLERRADSGATNNFALFFEEFRGLTTEVRDV